MKKIYKLLIFVFIVFGLVCTSVSVNGVDNIPDLEENTEIIEETPQPSEFALWIEENVIQVAIGIGTGVESKIIFSNSLEIQQLSFQFRFYEHSGDWMIKFFPAMVVEYRKDGGNWSFDISTSPYRIYRILGYKKWGDKIEKNN